MSAPADPPFPLYILTPRLVLQNWTLDDLPAAHAIYSHPEVMRWSPAGPSPSLETTRALVEEQLKSYAEHGIGQWAAALRATGEIIGYCGVAMERVHGLTPEPELGYRLLPEFRGQGYATEAARAALSHGLSWVGLPRILGLVEPANAASVRVLLKVGMTLRGQTVRHGQPADIYAIDKPPRPV